MGALLDYSGLSGNKAEFDFKSFSSELRFSLLTPLNSIIGYCELI